MSNIKACKQHRDNPAICYASCPGCEMERLRSERDIARRDYEVMNKFREAAEQERDAALEREQALAAHVESLRQYIGQWGDGYVSDEDMMKLLFKWAASPADGSLAHRDLIKQAEALEEFSNNWDWERMPNHKDLRHAAHHIRQRDQSLK